MTPLEKFKASHKAITNYHDIIEGGYEWALDGYDLGRLKAIHVYAGGLHMEEVFPQYQPRKEDLFCCCVDREYRTAETREELEPMLYEFWLENVYELAPKFTFEDAVEYPGRYTVYQLRKMLQLNDRNGEYEDASRAECIELVKDVMDNQVREGTA